MDNLNLKEEQLTNLTPLIDLIRRMTSHAVDVEYIHVAHWLEKTILKEFN